MARKLYIGNRPNQKIPYSKKVANDFEWAKDCIDYYGSQDSYIQDTTKEDIDKRFDWFNNKFDMKDFNKVVNPLNSKNIDYQQWGADLRPFNIMRPIIERISSEYRKRPFGYSVEVNNPDAVSKEETKLYNELILNIRQQFINYVNGEAGNEELTGLPSQPIEDTESIRERYSNMRDMRAIEGQHALELLINDTYARQLFHNGMLDWLIAGDIVTLKEIEDENIVYTKLKSLYCGWSSDSEFIEDGEFAWSYQYKSMSWVVDKFYSELTPQQIDDLNKGTKYSKYNSLGLRGNTNNTDDVYVLHCSWKSYKKIGILEYIDPQTGELSEVEVSEEYSPDEGENITWMWITEVWEGYKLNHDVYIRIRPIQQQRRKMNHKSACKLPYNGRIYSNDFNNRVSVASVAIPYQILYVIGFRQLELTLSKNKGKVLMLDKNIIPNDDGWDEEKFIYYGQALGYHFIDRNQVGVDKSYNQYQVMDMSTLGDVKNLIEFISWVEHQLKMTFGITLQREGQFSPKEGTGQREQDLFQSAVLTEEVFARYDEFVERELQGLLDYSKYCWRNGKRAKFIGSDQRSKILDIDPYNYQSLEFGVRVSTDSRTLDTIKRMQQATFAFAQNGASPETILEVLDAQNPSMLKEALNKMEARTNEVQERQAQQQQELVQSQATAEQQRMQQEHSNDLDKINVEYDRKEQLEAVKNLTTPVQNVPETPEDNTMDIKMMEDSTKKDIENRKISSAERIAAANIKDNQAERLNKRIIEKEKAKTALANKVVGEK